MLNEVLAGRFRITALLGSGGMGQVWAAEDERMRRDVAVKVVHPQYGAGEAEARDRFEREVQLAARLTHENIVTVHDWGEVLDGGRQTLYLVMELVDGTSLDKRLKGPVPTLWPLAIGWAAQITQALHAAHSQGVVHRDIKPANVLLRPDGTVKVLDFGVAKFLGDTVGARKLTATGALLGTPAYMSPEQIETTGTIDHRSDLYSLGCLLYHAVTGRPPFDGDSQWSIVVKHQQETPAPPSTRVEGLPPVLDDLVLKLLAKHPGDRPEDAAAVHDVLSTILVDQAVALSDPSILTTARLSTVGSLAGRLVTRAWQVWERSEQQAAERLKAAEAVAESTERSRIRAEAQARHLMEEARAEAERTRAAARAEARSIVAQAWDSTGTTAPDRADPVPLTDAQFEIFVKAAVERAVRRDTGEGDAGPLPHPERFGGFELVRRGYDRTQVDERLRELGKARVRRRDELAALEGKFVESRLRARTSARSSEEQREAVLRDVLQELDDVAASAQRELAAPRKERPKSDLPPFELVRRGYDREQVDRHIESLQAEQHNLLYRIMTLNRLPVPRRSYRKPEVR
ncbi:serine/threonine-protein kinase [Streptomyces sp. 351MFTsu5.1]|uniref:serine/threonine-protein kinase n=1 Tax=Streptomyces sp. 351MFTsu5.1 TaxID=1172180 RepID=UPI000368523A|nr:serine/threonine-protein kinase [Streptomyces sp. 351MFTsu5.1]